MLRSVLIILVALLIPMTSVSAASWKWIYSSDRYGYYIDQRDLPQVETYSPGKKPTLWVKISDEEKGIKYIDNITIDLIYQKVKRNEGRSVSKSAAVGRPLQAAAIPGFGSAYTPFYCYYLSKVPGAPAYEAMLNDKKNVIYGGGNKTDEKTSAYLISTYSIREGSGYYDCSYMHLTAYENGNVGASHNIVRFAKDGKKYTLMNYWRNKKHISSLSGKTYTVKPDTIVDHIYDVVKKHAKDSTTPKIILDSHNKRELVYKK